MGLEHRIREAELRLFARYGLRPEESYLDLAASEPLRVLSVGTGPPLVMLHGVSLAAAVWAPWLARLTGYRAHLVELPGHGLSGPFAYRAGAVRAHAVNLMDDCSMGSTWTGAPVIAHSLGGMFALWHAAAQPGRIASLAPSALRPSPCPAPRSGCRSRYDGPGPRAIVLRSPTHDRSTGACSAKGWARPRRRTPRTSCSTCCAWRSGGRKTPEPSPRSCTPSTSSVGPRTDSVMSDTELGRISMTTMFCWGQPTRS